MTISARVRSLALLSALSLTGCGSLLGYEDGYEVGASAGASSGGAAALSNVCSPEAAKYRCVGSEILQICNVASATYETAQVCRATERCDATKAACVATTGGGAGGLAGSGGKAGASSGGAAGQAGASGAGQAGDGGKGGAAGQAAGAGGAAGSDSAGQAGATSAGNAGSNAGGKAGGGQAGANAGQAGNSGGAGTSGAAGKGGAAGSGGAAGKGGGAGNGGAAGSTGNGGAAGSTGNGGAAGSTGNGGAAGNGGTAGRGGASTAGAGGAPNPTDCSVLYVSPNGEGDGCSPQSPLLAPSLAIARADLDAKVKEIRVCAGKWMGQVTLSRDLSLRGGYDCQTWQRSATLEPATLTTTIEADNDSPAFVVSGTVSRAALIEGIRINGRSGGARSRAMLVRDNTSPTIRRVRISGGSATGNDFPSTGLTISSGAAPRVEDSLIESGLGDTSASTVASVGVLLTETAGAAELVRNVIRGGDATLHGKGYGSAGLFVLPLSTARLTGAATVRDNIISAGDAVDVSGQAELLSTGVFLDSTSDGPRTEIAIEGGSISAGVARHTAPTPANRYPSAIGIFAPAHISLDVSRVRIYAGDSSEKTGTSIAVSLAGPGKTSLRSSVLHGGGTRFATPYPRAIESRQTGELTITGSTLLTGVPASVEGSEAGGTGLYLEGAGVLSFESVLWVLQAGYAVALQRGDTCEVATGSSLVRSAIAQTGGGQDLFAAPGCTVTDQTLSNLEAAFTTTAANVRVTPAPKTGDVGIVCASDAACLSQLIQGYDFASGGRVTTLTLTDGGLVPRLCPLQVGATAPMTAPFDLLGVERPATRATIGAIQHPNAAMTCP